MYADNEMLFPHYVIPALRVMRGPKWQALVERLLSQPECNDETLAFMLMMVRLNNCLACETDSFRAMRGCMACATQILRRYKGTDEELLVLYKQALRDIRDFVSDYPLVTQIGGQISLQRAAS